MTDLHASTRVTAESERLFAAAQRVLPGGVNSPVRAGGVCANVSMRPSGAGAMCSV